MANCQGRDRFNYNYWSVESRVKLISQPLKWENPSTRPAGIVTNFEINLLTGYSRQASIIRKKIIWSKREMNVHIELHNFYRTWGFFKGILMQSLFPYKFKYRCVCCLYPRLIKNQWWLTAKLKNVFIIKRWLRLSKWK